MSPSVSGFTCVKASARPSGDQPPALCWTAFDIEPALRDIALPVEPPFCGIVAAIELVFCGIAPGIEPLFALPIDEPFCMPLGGVTPMRGISIAASRFPGPLPSDGIRHIGNG